MALKKHWPLLNSGCATAFRWWGCSACVHHCKHLQTLGWVWECVPASSLTKKITMSSIVRDITLRHNHNHLETHWNHLTKAFFCSAPTYLLLQQGVWARHTVMKGFGYIIAMHICLQGEGHSHSSEHLIGKKKKFINVLKVDFSNFEGYTRMDGFKVHIQTTIIISFKNSVQNKCNCFLHKQTEHGCD